ncbi:DnaD domain-containing protein [Bacillus sp. PS06]|uniref:DnaD domain-containing protein n=1 Tax=Bacillus sp. PS06 TaxID=2764176 RepID=UPI00178015E7|nr:DnaD domain protein [Bacillus sp. PS06]MBD8069386.1 DnaD domain protein [Bacillus sp. PS06]
MTTQPLFPESPLLVHPTIATTLGLNESLILQQIHYWLERSTNQHDNHNWVYNTYEDWAKQFPFWSVSTIRRTITKLENLGILISANYNKLKLDKTKWYRINYDKLHELLPYPLEPMPHPCAQSNQSTQPTCTDEAPTFTTPLPESTSKIPSEILEAVEEAPLNPHHFYEENGFGTIGSYMSEKITAWSNDLSDELIIEAMKFAIEHSSKTWAYVEAILRDWIDKQYTTVTEVHTARLRYKEKQSTKQNRCTRTDRKETKTSMEKQIPSPEDLVRVGVELEKTAGTILAEVQQYHPLLDEKSITAFISKRIQHNTEAEKRSQEMAKRFEALVRKKQQISRTHG